MTDRPLQLVADFAPAGDQPQAIAHLVDGLQNGLAKQTLLGVTGSGKTFSMASVISTVQRPTLILAHNKTLAAQLYGEMREFFPHNAVEYFVSYYDYYQPEAYVPSSDTYIEKDASINSHIEQMRLSATKAVLERRDVIIVATVSAIYGLGDPEAYHGMVLHLARGSPLNQRDLLRRLTELQYARNPLDLSRGTYRVRGDVIDIFPAESEKDAVRVELFDDEIEQISFFDPLTGEVTQRTPRATIYPKTHYVTPRETLLACVDQIRADLVEQLERLRGANKLVEAQRLEQRTRFDLEMILEVGYCNGIENYSRYLSGRQPGEPPPCLFDYLPDNALLFVDESHATIPQIGGMYKGDRSRKETLVTYGFRLPSALDNRPLSFDEYEQIAPQTIFVSATPGPYERAHADQTVEQVVRPTGLINGLMLQADKDCVRDTGLRQGGEVLADFQSPLLPRAQDMSKSQNMLNWNIEKAAWEVCLRKGTVLCPGRMSLQQVLVCDLPRKCGHRILGKHEFFTPHCGAAFDENSAPLRQGGLQERKKGFPVGLLEPVKTTP